VSSSPKDADGIADAQIKDEIGAAEPSAAMDTTEQKEARKEESSSSASAEGLTEETDATMTDTALTTQHAPAVAASPTEESNDSSSAAAAVKVEEATTVAGAAPVAVVPTGPRCFWGAHGWQRLGVLDFDDETSSQPQPLSFSRHIAMMFHIQLPMPTTTHTPISSQAPPSLASAVPSSAVAAAEAPALLANA
jgi:hypothetical protein